MNTTIIVKLKFVEAINEKALVNGEHAEPKRRAAAVPRETAFGRPRDFLNNQYVYAVISSRARGLSLGVNVNPDKYCDFTCVYCEVDRRQAAPAAKLDVEAMTAELRRTIAFVQQGRLRELPAFQALPAELLQLRHVALSGDGEPTLAPNFPQVVEAAIGVRALGGFPFFKLVLITNGSGLDQPHVLAGLEHFTKSDEIWVKLDGGTQEFVDRINHPKIKLEQTLANILSLARQRPVVIQSLFAAVNGEEPAYGEIRQYADRLKELKRDGAQISVVQIYSATRPVSQNDCGHLPLKTLSFIAQTVRNVAGLKAEVF
jgi:wyosine [tRNA(Phe)-imidazoG37] synthetase (radical SAM superfamily)